MAATNLVIRHGKRSYKILEPIGKWGPDFSLIVYEAAMILEDGNGDRYKKKEARVAFKMIPNSNELSDFHTMAMDDLNRSDEYKTSTRYILPILGYFYSDIDGTSTLCIVMPYDVYAVPLRTLLSNSSRFNKGFDGKLIGIALRFVLKALNRIHKVGHYHTQITTGSIFYNHRLETIQLAFGASSYEPDFVENDDPVCSVNNMLAWGLAPEAKDADDMSMRFVDEYDSEKSDIWLVGIVALELAYGKIVVENRRELLNIASYISEVKMLPNTWEELRRKSAEFIAAKAMPLKKRMLHDSDIALSAEMEEKRFSDFFSSLVAMCLATDEDFRPSAKELKKHVFLQNNVGSIAYFHSVVVNGLNPRIARFFLGRSGRNRSESAGGRLRSNRICSRYLIEYVAQENEKKQSNLELRE